MQRKSAFSWTTLVVLSMSCLLAGIPALAQGSTECTPTQETVLMLDFDGDDGFGPNVFIRPELSSVAIDALGNAYVAGFESNNVFRVSPMGIAALIFANGQDEIALEQPSALTVDPNGVVYVTGFGSDNVVRIGPGGASEVAAGLDGPAGVVVNASGNLYVASFDGNRVVEIDGSGQVTEVINVTGDGAGNVLARPLGVALDASGNLYVAGFDSDNVLKRTPGGVITEIVDFNGDGIGGVLDRPRGLAADALGNIFVAGERSDNLLKIESDGTVTEILNAEAGDGPDGLSFARAYGVAVDASGTCYVAGRDSHNLIAVTPDGTISEVTSGARGIELDKPSAVAIDGSGNVFVAGFNSDNLLKVTLSPDDVNCNTVDDDCDGETDEGFFSETCFTGLPGVCTAGLSTCDETGLTCVPETAPTAEICDGLDNDCDGVADEEPVDGTEYFLDADGDGFGDPATAIRLCTRLPDFVTNDQDCNDASAESFPGGIETCDGNDNDCNGLIDEDEFGEDEDSDGIGNLCDNCRFVSNPGQRDADFDGIGNNCDNCELTHNVDQLDADLDGLGNACDNCIDFVNLDQDDFDADGVGDDCDSCPFDANPSQADSDGDDEGDLCDLDDGLVYLGFSDTGSLAWQNESGFSSWNVYGGSLVVLRDSGTYTQSPGSNALASQDCGLASPVLGGIATPTSGEVIFFLVTGVGSGTESDLGDSTAGPRPNANPCP